jgi:hypothetical protein
MKPVLGAVLIAVALSSLACGGGDDEIGIGDTLETEGGATYKVNEATVAETEDSLYEALGQTKPAPSLPAIPGVPQFQSQSYGPPAGVYVAVELAEAGGTDGSGDTTGKSEEGGKIKLLGGDGEEYESVAFQLSFGPESLTEDGGATADEEITTTDIFDVPVNATEGAQLQIDEGGTEYTIDLGL